MSEMFYVSDSFSLTGYNGGDWHYPGAANSAAAWSPNKPVACEWFNGEVGFVVYVDALQGTNADVFMCLYDLGNVVGGIAQPVLVGGQPVPFKFLASDDSPLGDAILMNGVHRVGQYSHAGRYLTKPLRVGGVTTPATGGPFQVGALFRFFGPIGPSTVLNYQYFMHGQAINADLVPTPPPSGGGSVTLSTPSGAYTWGVV